MEQLYSEAAGKFLADRLVSGRCPKCNYEVRCVCLYPSFCPQPDFPGPSPPFPCLGCTMCHDFGCSMQPCNPSVMHNIHWKAGNEFLASRPGDACTCSSWPSIIFAHNSRVDLHVQHKQQFNLRMLSLLHSSNTIRPCHSTGVHALALVAQHAKASNHRRMADTREHDTTAKHS